jgi:predicted dehydrogenase
VVPDEASAYGYTAENRHFCRVFLGREKPLLTFDDGVDVMRMLMGAYMSAEKEKTVTFPPRGVETFVPAVASGTWRP